METNKIYEGNCLDVMRTFEDNSVDCIITSPPYWQLRHYDGIPDYIWGGNADCEHDWDEKESHIDNLRFRPGENPGTGNSSNEEIYANPKVNNAFCKKCNAWRGQLGLEPTFQLFLEHLWLIMDECYRVLKPTGTCWINLGDTYSGSNGFGFAETLSKENRSTGGVDGNRNYRKETGRKDSLPAKSLILIPYRFALGCQDRNWIVRNDIIWAKKNNMPESVTDRFSKKHEYLFLMVKDADDYYFDLDSIRENKKQSSLDRELRGLNYNKNTDGSGGQSPQGINQPRKARTGGKNNYTLHEDETESLNSESQESKGKNPGDVSDFWNLNLKGSKDEHYASFNFALIERPIMAGCPKGGIVLDPFCGTATTGVRAIQLGRLFVGIEGSGKYAKIGNRNLDKERLQPQMF